MKITSSFWKRSTRVLLLAVLPMPLALSAVDETRPAPLKVPLSKAMTEPYRILLKRSVFSKDHNRIASVYRPSPLPETRPAYVPQPDTSSPLAEANITLRGISSEDGDYMAFFEGSVDRQFFRVRPGGAVSHGKISSMTLDGIEYSTADKTTHILIGQSLAGGYYVASTQPSSTTSTTQPSGGGATAPGEKPSWWRRPK